MISPKSELETDYNNQNKSLFNPIKSSGEERKSLSHWILNFLLTTNRFKLLKMIDFYIDKKSLILDLGCNIGALTGPLSLRAKTIGLDIDKEKLFWAKKFNHHIEFICCDLCNLPLRESSVDIVIASSVLEHIENLQSAIKEIKFVLTKQGQMATGYPLETRLLEFAVKLFYRSESSTWEQHNIRKYKELLKSPHTHKQNFVEIRKILQKDFLHLKTRKIPQNSFPDFLSIYEIKVLVIK